MSRRSIGNSYGNCSTYFSNSHSYCNPYFTWQDVTTPYPSPQPLSFTMRVFVSFVFFFLCSIHCCLYWYRNLIMVLQSKAARRLCWKVIVLLLDFSLVPVFYSPKYKKLFFSSGSHYSYVFKHGGFLEKRTAAELLLHIYQCFRHLRFFSFRIQALSNIEC